MPVVSGNGLKQTVTIRSGLMWNMSLPRPVTAQDVVRGIKRACNPSPYAFGGMADFESTIQGLTAYCSGYPALRRRHQRRGDEAVHREPLGVRDRGLG